jgi:uncharacterized alpha-E superfamily protein
MRDRIDSVVVASAYGGKAAGENLGEGMHGGELAPPRRQRIRQSIEERGIDFVLQEAVRLSTMPVWHNGRLEPRPFTLRVFLARHDGGFAVMPGGFVRIGNPDDTYAITLQRGALTADAWIPSTTPLVETTLLPSPDRIQVKRTSGSLPSRAADNLFWLGRYMERTEATLRLVRALLARISDNDRSEQEIEPIAALLHSWGAAPGDLAAARPLAFARAALQRRDLPGSAPTLARAARSAGSVIRDRLSPDAWRALNDLVAAVDAPLPAGASESVMLDRVERALRIISSFSGLAQENMTRLAGWRFLELGRRIERAILTCRFVRELADPLAPEGALDVLLELCDSQMTYRQRYVMIAARTPVIDLVMLDPNNPRSVVYQLDRVEAHLAALPKSVADGRLSPPQQIAASIATGLRTADAAKIDTELILGSESALMRLSETIDSSHLAHNERSEAVWEALA